MISGARLKGGACGVLALSLLVTACATTHLAEPVGRGRTRMNVSLGGPLINLIGPTPIPLPLTSLGVAHGIEDNLDVHADLHPTALVFSPGNGSIPLLGADVGVAWHPIPGHLRALTLGATVFGFTNRLDGVVFADLWIGTGIRPARWIFLSAGLHNSLRLGVSDREVADRFPWQGTVYALASFGPIRGRTKLDVEFRWYAFNENLRNTAPGWVPLGPYGGLGVLLGVTHEFGDPR